MNAIEYAINMEQEGEKYYAKQAKLNKDNSLYKVCTMLAEDEKKHADILIKLMKKAPYKLTNTKTYSETKNIFQETNDFKSEIKEIPSQLDFYNMALEKEQQSIDLYSEFISKANNDNEKELFNYLIQQEKLHYQLLEELALLLRNAEEWVESAEFGIREEY